MLSARLCDNIALEPAGTMAGAQYAPGVKRVRSCYVNGERKGVTMDLDVLRQLKRQKKMTNKQLSQASGVPLGTINKLMSGVTDNPKLPTVQAIARALGTTVDGIAGSAVAPEEAAPSGMSTLSLREEQLLSLLRRLDDRGFDTVFSAARAQLELLSAPSPEETDIVGNSVPPSNQTVSEPSWNAADPLTPPAQEQMPDAAQPEGFDGRKKLSKNGKADKAGKPGKIGKTGKGRKAVKESKETVLDTDGKESRKGKKGKKHKG